MKRAVFGLLVCVCIVQAEIIAGVAMRVNGHAITLNEIKEAQSRLKLSRQAAIDMLINERLKDDEIERFKISVDEFKVDEEIGLIAADMNLSKDALLAKMARKGVSLQEYRAQVKKQLQTKELMQKIISSNISISSEDELLRYYTKHKKEFMIPSKVRAVRYTAQSENLLQQAISAQSHTIGGVQKLSEVVELSALAPQIAQVFIHTPNDEFTPVLTSGANGFVSFLIKERMGEKLISFEEAKPLINQKLMAQKQQNIITEHFNKIRASADIVTLRE